MKAKFNTIAKLSLITLWILLIQRYSSKVGVKKFVRGKIGVINFKLIKMGFKKYCPIKIPCGGLCIINRLLECSGHHI